MFLPSFCLVRSNNPITLRTADKMCHCTAGKHRPATCAAAPTQTSHASAPDKYTFKPPPQYRLLESLWPKKAADDWRHVSVGASHCVLERTCAGRAAHAEDALARSPSLIVRSKHRMRLFFMSSFS